MVAEQRDKPVARAAVRGVVALVSASDGSRRSIVRTAADGTVVHAPREFGMGTPIDLDVEPAFSTALAADERGFTAALAVGSDATPIRVTCYDWTDSSSTP
ncbi:MAG: hypothetical protein U0353_19930 [Sandaracinus sp.]